MRHQWTRSCWEQEAPFASPLPLFQCSFVPPKGCSAAISHWPCWLSHMAPHRKDLKTSLKHLCDHESPGRDTLHPTLLPKAHDSDRHFTASPTSPSALPPPQEAKPAASSASVRTVSAQCHRGCGARGHSRSIFWSTSSPFLPSLRGEEEEGEYPALPRQKKKPPQNLCLSVAKNGPQCRGINLRPR